VLDKILAVFQKTSRYFFVVDQRKRVEGSKMDELICLFAEKTPIHMLENHRQHMRKCTRSIMQSAFNTLFAVFGMHAQSENLPSEDCIVTGSVAEGASVARLFSPDSKTSREYEIDIMLPLAGWPTEEGMVYVENNKAFLHIVVDPDVPSLVRSFCGEDVVEMSYRQKEDGGTYMTNQVAKANLKQLAATPNIFNDICFRKSNSYLQCEDGSAAFASQMFDVSDRDTEPCGLSDDASSAASLASREAQIAADASATHLRITGEMSSYNETFQIRISEMLAHLETVHCEFMDMRKSEAFESLYQQASKALEWALTCADIADVIFDARESTALRYLKACWGVAAGWAEEDDAKNRARIKQKLQIYIDQLTTVSEDDVSNVSAAAAVRALLSDIERTEIAPRRYSVLFREFVRLQEKMFDGITWVNQNQQLLEIPQPLQQLSGSLVRCSFDLVLCFKLMFWPSVAADWKTRSRLWPDRSVVEEIVGRGAHLVEKAFCHVDIDWRLSFSVAEIELATRWSPVQHFVYFVFKSLFYKFIKPLSAADNSAAAAADVSPGATANRKYLSSYVAKTVMMWTSEGSDQSWWTEANAGECLTVLLLAMQSAFQCRTLDHYFVSSVNLLEGLPDIVADRVIDTVSFILADPGAVAGQLGNDLDRVQVFFDAMPAQSDFDKRISDLENIFSSFTSFPT